MKNNLNNQDRSVTTNVRLVYPGGIRRVKLAVRRANEILSDPEFYEQIKGYKKFDHTDLSPNTIARLMQENNHEINVKVSLLALFVPAYTNSKNKIILSFWNFSKNLPSAVNTLIHETVNAIEFLNTKKESNKYKSGQQPTAPWVIGAIAEVMVK